MKNVSFALVLLVSTAAFSSESTDQIYAAFNVKEKLILSDSVTGIELFQKNMAGLDCTKLIDNKGNESTLCTVSSDFDAASIYGALATEEEALTAPKTDTLTRKTAGRLVCEKKDVIRKGASFICWVSF